MTCKIALCTVCLDMNPWPALVPWRLGCFFLSLFSSLLFFLVPLRICACRSVRIRSPTPPDWRELASGVEVSLSGIAIVVGPSRFMLLCCPIKPQGRKGRWDVTLCECPPAALVIPTPTPTPTLPDCLSVCLTTPSSCRVLPPPPATCCAACSTVAQLTSA